MLWIQNTFLRLPSVSSWQTSFQTSKGKWQHSVLFPDKITFFSCPSVMGGGPPQQCHLHNDLDYMQFSNWKHQTLIIQDNYESISRFGIFCCFCFSWMYSEFTSRVSTPPGITFPTCSSAAAGGGEVARLQIINHLQWSDNCVEID